MRLKTSTPPTTTTYTPSASLTAPVAQTPTTISVTPVASSVRRQKKSRRRWSLARLALWIVGLMPLVALGLTLKKPVALVLAEQRLLPEKFFPAPSGALSNGFIISPDGHWLVQRTLSEKLMPRGNYQIWNNQTQVFDTETGKQKALISNMTGISYRIGINADGSQILTAESGDYKKEERRLLWRSATDGNVLKTVLYPGTDSEVVFSRDNQTLLAAEAHRVVLRSTQTGTLETALTIPKVLGKKKTTGRATQLALSPNKEWITARVLLENKAWDQEGARIVLWRRGESSPRWSVPVQDGNSANTIAVADEGTVLATVAKIIPTADYHFNDNDFQGVICLEAATGKERWFFPKSQTKNGIMATLALDLMHQWAAVRYSDRVIEVRNLRTGALITEIDTRQKVSNNGVYGERLRFSSDGMKLYDRQNEGIGVWSLAGLK